MHVMMLQQIISGVDTFLNIISVWLLVYALMTWFVRPDNPIYVFVARFADVILTPFRPISRWLINYGLHMDLSVILALFAIRILRSLLVQILVRVIY
ncbi:MAG: YggT family protein [Clostridia bacterium]|nr:YggT family protein [Clostridia bacterium]